MKYLLSIVFAAVFLCVLTSLTVRPATIRVPEEQPTIQAGIDAASDGDTVLVADGTYVGAGNMNLSFKGKNIDVLSELGCEACIIDCQGVGSGFNFHDQEQADSVLEGFTIRNATIGIVSWSGASPSISNCRIIGNSVHESRGIDCTGDVNLFSYPSISNCIIKDNFVSDVGAGIGCYGYCYAVINNCVIENNTVNGGGGGIYCGPKTAPTITNCLISGNSALVRYGGRGGGIYCDPNSSPVIENCTISNNYAVNYGGGIFCHSGPSPVIGGSPGSENRFENNYAGAGADLGYYLEIPETPLNARFNIFAGLHQSDYYVSPQEAFDVSGGISETVPVMQDVFVSVDGSDENDGLSWETAFLTVHKALKTVCADEDNPLTIHIGTGLYSEEETGESFPLPAVEFVSVRGTSAQSVFLHTSEAYWGMYFYQDDLLELSDLTCRGGIRKVYMECSSPIIRNCIFTGIGGGVDCNKESSPLITGCSFISNASYFEGGAIAASVSSPIITDCEAMFNSSANNQWGGAFAFDYYGSPLIVNCYIAYNYAENVGGGLAFDRAMHGTPIIVENCTLRGNAAGISGGAVHCPYSTDLHMRNSIFWDNAPDQIVGVEPDVTYSDIQGGFQGEGNIDENPFFTGGICGDGYLSQTAAGQHEDSPCVDSGGDPASEICFDTPEETICLDELTTRTDQAPDEGTVDMGFHYMSPTPAQTNTLTPAHTFTVTPAPTSTPTLIVTPPYTRTPVLQLGVTLQMPDDCFSPGDECELKAFLHNYTGYALPDIPLFVILDINAEYWFWDGWSREPAFNTVDVPYGTTVISVVEPFVWPDTGNQTMEGLAFLGAMTDYEFTSVLGGEEGIGDWTFGYGPE